MDNDASDWICFLQSELQGRFTYHNVLAQLGGGAADAAECEALKPSIDWVMDVGRRVAGGEAPFVDAAERGRAQGELSRLAERLDEAADALDTSLTACARQDTEAMRRVVAVFAWRMYAYDNRIRSLQFFAQRFGQAERADYLLQQTPHAQRVIGIANTFFGWCRDPERAPPDLAGQLVAESSHLPPLIAASAQEARRFADSLA